MAKLGRFALMILALYIAWVVGRPLGVTLAGPFLQPMFGDNPFPEWVVGFIATYAAFYLVVKLLGGIFGAGKSGENNTTLFRRRSIGYLGRAMIAALLIIGLWIATKILFSVLFVVAPWLFTVPPSHSGPATMGDVFGIVRLFLFLPVWIGLAAWLVHKYSRPLKIFIGRKSVDLRRNLRLGTAGYGGSASFGGLLDEWANPFEPGSILVGKSLYDPGWAVGIRDDRHVITVAGTGAGKGRTTVIPNLLEWPHSALVIDPKGTNAAVTGAARGNGGGRVKSGLGQKVYCINPFGVNARLPGMPPSAAFNPLSVLSKPPTFSEVDQIAEAIIIDAEGKDKHFTDSAKSIVAGVIDLVSKTVPNGHLGHVRDYLLGPRGKLAAALEAAGGIATAGYAQMRAASENELGGILSTAIVQTKWLDEPGIRDALSHNDFNFMDLQREATTVYLILPPSETVRQSRFLRLFVNLAFMAAVSSNRTEWIDGSTGEITNRGKVPVLYVLDEFYNLGPMLTLTSAAALIRSYGVKLWPFVQGIGQLRELYGQNFQTFQGNAGFANYFSLNDTESLNHVAERMGARVEWTKDQAGNSVAGKIASLRTGEEIGRETGRAGGRCYVLREGNDPMVLARLNYDEYYPAYRYNQDPDIKVADDPQPYVRLPKWDLFP